MGELVEAYHGVNQFGASVAEIRSSRFQKYNPSVHDNYTASSSVFRVYAEQLVELCMLFKTEYRCEISISGFLLEEIPEMIREGSFVFDTRAIIAIQKVQ